MAKATAEAEAPTEEAQSQKPDDAVEVGDVELPQATGGAVTAAPSQIDILLDSTVSVSAGLGETSMQVRDLLQLGPGSVVKLDRQVGQPLDLYLRGIHFAKGQLVVVEEHLAVRITEILSPQNEQDE